METNLTKSASVCFNRKVKAKDNRPTAFSTPPPFSFSPTEPLPQCSSYKYLGLIFDERLQWAEHTAAVRTKLQHSATMVSSSSLAQLQ